MLSFTIGESKFAHLTVQVLMRSHLGANDYWDGNWLDIVLNFLLSTQVQHQRRPLMSCLVTCACKRAI